MRIADRLFDDVLDLAPLRNSNWTYFASISNDTVVLRCNRHWQAKSANKIPFYYFLNPCRACVLLAPDAQLRLWQARCALSCPVAIYLLRRPPAVQPDHPPFVSNLRDAPQITNTAAKGRHSEGDPQEGSPAQHSGEARKSLHRFLRSLQTL